MQRFMLLLLASLALAACVEEDVQFQPLEPPPGMVTITARHAIFGVGVIETQPLTFAAYQEEDGPWQPMTIQGGVYAANIAPGRYAIAMGQRKIYGSGDERTLLEIRHSTTAEATEQTFYPGFDVSRPYQLLLDIRGVGLNERAAVSFQGIRTSLDNGIHAIASPSPAGELLVVLYTDSTELEVPIKIARIQNVSLLDSSPVIIDFNLPSGAPRTDSVAFGGATSGVVRSYVKISAHESVYLGSSLDTFYSLPNHLTRPSDLLLLHATAPTTPGVPIQTTYYYPLGAGPLLLHYGTASAPAAPSLLPLPYPRLSFPVPAPERLLPFVDYKYSFGSYVSRGAATISTQWVLLFTDGWLGGATSSRYDAPVFTGLPGWADEMAPPWRNPVWWAATVSEQNGRQFQPGRISRSTSDSGTIGSYCGNGIVEQPWEVCDPPDGVTCSSNCQPIYLGP